MSSVGKVLGIDTVFSNAGAIAPIPNDAVTSSSDFTSCEGPVALTPTSDGEAVDGVIKNCHSSIYESAFDFPDLSSSLREGIPEVTMKVSCHGRVSSTLTSPTKTEIAITTPEPTPGEAVQDICTPSLSQEGNRSKHNGDCSLVVSPFTLSIATEGGIANAGMGLTQGVYNDNNGTSTMMGPMPTSVMYATPPQSQQTLADATHSGAPPCRIPPPLPLYPSLLMLNSPVGQFHMCSKSTSKNFSQGLSYSLRHHVGDMDGEFNNSFSYVGATPSNKSVMTGSINTPLIHTAFLCGQQQPLPVFDGSTHMQYFPDPFSFNTNSPRGNVHDALQGAVQYVPYNLSPLMNDVSKFRKVPNVRNGSRVDKRSAHIVSVNSDPNKPGEQVLPVFIQMFPCELRDRTIIVLNRVVEATCGPDIATVVGIEPRSETSFIALVRTDRVWDLIHKLRCRVLMDRHGFWYAENFDQYMRLKEYCENVRRLPQQTRHFQTDGLPCMPLVVELSRSVDASAVTSPPADPSFDKVAPIATVERHVRVKGRRG
ncbi:hypothetical protein LSM04_009592 [Trypanosoma melophagium]|uniref:uncharacterized protein n=1 Tax=Trypanosoma melophagium TaxID=715481 RepID=UPI00351AAEEF|nr:hypothetical protein LSM04_009592 [Trypanosoma melophagium]